MSIDVTQLADRDDVKLVAFHEKALEAVRDMARLNEAVAQTYGETSPEYLRQIASFNQVIPQVLNAAFGRASYVGRDDPFALYVQEGGFVFGVVFFRDRNHEGAAVQPGTWSCHR